MTEMIDRKEALPALPETDGEQKKLILGFDVGCGTCSDLAASVQERVGDKLSVENLNEPQLLIWREEALGKEAKWAPTLFEVEGEKVLRAWTGWKMGFALSRKLGPSSTWQVMQALGEVGAAPKVEETAVVEKLPEKAAEAVSGMSRSQFIKGVGGAAVAISIVSGGLLVSPAEAARRNPWATVRRRKITGKKKMELSRTRGKRRDVRNVVGNRLATPAKVRAAKPQVFKHRLRNGSNLLAIAYTLPKNRILLYNGYSKAMKNRGRIQVMLLQVVRRGNSNHLVIIKASEGGRLWRKKRSAQSRRPQGGHIEPLAYCPPGGGTSTRPPIPTTRTRNVCGGRNGTRTTKVCVDKSTASKIGCGAVAVGCPAATAGGGGLLGFLAASSGCAGGWAGCSGCDGRYEYVEMPCNVIEPAGP